MENFPNSKNQGNACFVAGSEIPVLIVKEGKYGKIPLRGLEIIFSLGHKEVIIASIKFIL